MAKRPNERIDPGVCVICGNGEGFPGGGAAQLPSLPWIIRRPVMESALIRPILLDIIESGL